MAVQGSSLRFRRHPAGRRRVGTGAAARPGRRSDREQGPAHWPPHARPGDAVARERARTSRRSPSRRTSSSAAARRSRSTTRSWPGIVSAEIAGRYLGKGQQVAIEGRLQTRSWDDDKGARHWKTEIVASHVEMLSGRKKKDYEAQQAADSLGGPGRRARRVRGDRADRRGRVRPRHFGRATTRRTRSPSSTPTSSNRSPRPQPPDTNTSRRRRAPSAPSPAPLASRACRRSRRTRPRGPSERAARPSRRPNFRWPRCFRGTHTDRACRQIDRGRPQWDSTMPDDANPQGATIPGQLGWRASLGHSELVPWA